MFPDSDPILILITGIMAAGKSSVAQELAERLPHSVHLRGDVFRRMIVSGRAPMGQELSPDASAQLTLRYQIAASAARLYLAAGFSVVYQDIILGADLPRVAAGLRDLPLHVVALCPSVEAVTAREAGREKIGYGGLSVAVFDRFLRAETPRIGLWVDSSAWSTDQTVAHILTHLEQARITAIT